MSNECAVSILVPVCNVQKYLRECLDGLVGQKLRDIQIICIDDGSTDLSSAILDEYRNSDSRIEVITKPNTGYGNSMNCGLDAARGEYIGIVESDDIASKDMFSDMYTLAKTHDADVVKGNFYYHPTNQEIEEDSFEENLRECQYNAVFSPLKHHEVFLTQPAIWSAIYKRSLLVSRNIRFLETPGASFQDTSFNFKVLAVAERVVATPKGYLHYRIDNDNSSVKSLKKVFCICDEYEEIWSFARSREYVFESLRFLIPQIQYGGYIWNLNRLTPALQYGFFEAFIDAFRQMDNEGLLRQEYFNEQAWATVKEMLDDPDGFFKRVYGPIAVKTSWIVNFGEGDKRGFELKVKALLGCIGENDELVCLTPNAEMKPVVDCLHKQDSRVFADEDLFLCRKFGYLNLSRLRGESVAFVDVSSAEDFTGKAQGDVLAANMTYQEDGIRISCCAVSTLQALGVPLVLSLAAMAACSDDSKADCALWLEWTNLFADVDCGVSEYADFYKMYPEIWAWAYSRFCAVQWHDVYEMLAAIWGNMQRTYSSFSYDSQLRLGERPSPSRLMAFESQSHGRSLSIAPEVSVVIPVYNAEAYLKECLASVLRQNVTTLEVICVNDGSTDASLEILEKIALRDARIRVFSQPNGGAGAARNRGIDAARGEYLAFIDPDDCYAADDVLSRAIEAAKSHNALVCGGSLVAFQDSNNEVYAFGREEQEYTFQEEGFREFAQGEFDYGWIRFVYHHSLFEDGGIRFPEIRWYEDPVFLVRVMERAKRYYALPYDFYLYRIGHKTVKWDALKTRDMLDGIIHNMKFAAANNMDVLYSRLFKRLEYDYAQAIMDNLDDAGVLTRMAEIQSQIDLSRVTYLREKGIRSHVLVPLCASRDTAVIRVARKISDSAFYQRIQALRERF